MAKWGEGDPRWIVEKRSDVHNVNNWHWRERDATEWSKKKLHKLLKDLSIVDENSGTCYIDEITSCDGEASVSNRKKKIICFYEFQIKAKWKGSLNGNDIKYTGQLEIPNLSEENEPDEVDVEITFGKDQRECRALKEVMRKKGAKLIRSKLKEYADCLKTECGSTIQVPEKDEKQTKKVNNQTATSDKNVKNEMRDVVTNASKPDVGMRIHTKKLVMSETFMTEVDELFKTMTYKDRMSAWTRSKITTDVASGEPFSLFDGNVSGKYTDIVKNKKISMKWRFKSWPEAHHSSVTLSFQQTPQGAQIQLEQTGVPQDAIEATRMGWKNYYWSSIKMTFGYGSRIL